MANLDDFFKKKDGKKSKGKKFAVNNPLLSANDKEKNGKVKQENPTSFVNQALLENANDLFSSQTTDEWKDFVEEKKDYTGLKIQNLQINDDEDKSNVKEQESEEETEVDDNGQTVVKKKQPSGPWKVIQDQKKEEVKEKVEEKKPAPPPAEPVKPKPSAYVPPARRNEVFDRPPSSASKKADLPPKEHFPTLGSTVPTPSGSANQGKKTKTNAK